MARVLHSLTLALALTLAWGLVPSPSRAERPELIAAIGELDYPPFYFTRDGALTGASHDIAQAVAGRAGYRLRFERFPWARLLRMLETGRADLSIHMFNTPERAAAAIMTSVPHVFENSTLFTRRGADPIGWTGDIESLSGQLVGRVRGYSHGRAFDGSASMDRMDHANEATLIQVVVGGRLDLGIGNRPAILHHATALGLRDQIAFLGPDVDIGPCYFAISRAHPEAHEIAAAFTRATVDLLDTPEYGAILATYGFKKP